jgi:hypothetical protein
MEMDMFVECGKNPDLSVNFALLNTKGYQSNLYALPMKIFAPESLSGKVFPASPGAKFRPNQSPITNFNPFCRGSALTEEPRHIIGVYISIYVRVGHIAVKLILVIISGCSMNAFNDLNTILPSSS